MSGSWRGACLRLVLMSALLSGTAFAQPPQAPVASSPDPTAAKDGSFLQRWERFYKQDWAGTAASGPAAPRRGLPSPLNSPPFPSSDWSYGGSLTIGESDGNV